MDTPLEASEAGDVEPTRESDGSVYSERSLLLSLPGIAIALFSGAGAGLTAGLTAAAAAGLWAGIAVGVLTGLGGATIAFLFVVSALNSLVGRRPS